MLQFLNTPTSFAQQACNGMAKLCDRRFDQVVFPTTHNSTALEVGSGPNPVLFVPNQNRTIEEQLNDGVRGFMIDLWYWKGEVYVCHRFCALGGQPLLGVMQTFEQFLKNHPNEVVSIIFENYVSGSDLEKVMMDSGLLHLLHVQDSRSPWPTLGQMIRKKKQMVVFREFDDEGPDWYMSAWKYAVETFYSYSNESEFTCEFNRGLPENSLYILNHFITTAFFRRVQNQRVNGFDALVDRAHLCFEEKKKVPNFLTVDFYTEDLIRAARRLNEDFQN